MTPTTLARIHAAAFTQTRAWSSKEFADLLPHRGMILCGDVRSFILGRIIGDEAEVLTLATHPDHQRQGHARTQLLTFLRQVHTLTAATVFLEVAENNKLAKSLYFNEGFHLVGHRPRYYKTTDGNQIGADILRLTF